MRKIWLIFWVASIVFTQATGLLARASTAPDNDDVAIIIGNKTYLDQDIPPVSFAHNDAQAMKLFAQHVLNIRDENILYLEDATQAQMETAFGRAGNHRGKAFQYVKPDVSNLYVFYSGHGVPGLRDQKSYLLPVDADIETAEINGFPLDVLYENLSRVEAKSVSIFLDACFSGNSHAGPLIRNASGAQIVSSETAQDLPVDFNILSAATEDQLASWDEENRHGLFTEYLMRALYGQADYDQDGEINLEEIQTFLERDMRYKARRTYNRDQIPTLSGNGQRVMVAAVDGAFPDRPALVRPPLLSAPISQTDDVAEHELRAIDAPFEVVKNANVRALPHVEADKIDVLRRGEEVFVTDKLMGKPWYRVALAKGQTGFIYQTLLQAKKEDARDDIQALKERLARLEEAQSQRGEDPVVLPPAPSETPQSLPNAIFGPDPNWSFDAFDAEEDIRQSLKKMGALLSRQSYLSRTSDGAGQSFLKYNWIKVEAESCRLNASVSFRHDRKLNPFGANRAIHIHDRQVSFDFRDPLPPKKERVLKMRNADDLVLMESKIYRLKPFTFKSETDRTLFEQQARQLQRLCRDELPPRPAREARFEDQQERRIERFEHRPAQREFRRPPPPRRF